MSAFIFLIGKVFFGNIDFKFLFRFKFSNHLTKEPYVSPANKALVGTLISVGDVINNSVRETYGGGN